MLDQTQLITKVFRLAHIPNTGEEQWQAMAVQQGYLTPIQQRHLAVLAAMRALIVEMGGYVTALPTTAQYADTTLIDYIQQQQLLVPFGSVEDTACSMLDIYVRNT